MLEHRQDSVQSKRRVHLTVDAYYLKMRISSVDGGVAAPDGLTRAARRGTVSRLWRKWAEPWSDSLTANPGQRLTVPDSLTALTALSLTA